MGLLDDFASGVGQAGMTLAGGDPGLAQLSDEQKQSVGARSLLNFGLSMLMNSGPSYTPHSFGQAFAAGMMDAQRTPERLESALTEGNIEKAKLGISAGGLGVQQALAGLKGQELQIQLAKLKAAQDMVNNMGPLLGFPSKGTGNAPGTGPATPTPPSANQQSFVTQYLPLAQTTAQATGLPVDFILGQAAHETGFGTSHAAGNNNFFGITDPKSGQLMAYASPEAGFKAYADLMQSDRYKGVPRTGDATTIGDAAAAAGYNPNVRVAGQDAPGGTYGDRVGRTAAMVRALMPSPGGSAGTKAAAATPPATPPPTPAIASDVQAMIAGMDQAKGGAGTALVAGPGAPTGNAPAAAPTPPGPGYDPATGVRQRGTPDAPAGTGTPMPGMPNVAIQDLPPAIRQAYLAQFQAAAASGDPEKIRDVLASMTKDALEYAKQERWRTLAPAEARTELGPGYDPTVTYRANQFGKVEPIGPGIAPLNPADTPEGQWNQTLNRMAETRMGKLGEQADKARDNLAQLDTVKALSDASGGANPIGQMELGGKRVVDWATALGLGTPEQISKWTAQQALNGALTKLSLDLRSGQGMGRLTNQELQYVQNSVPNPAQTPQTRNAMIAYLRDMYQRQVDYQTEVGNQLQLPGPDGKRKSIAQAEADAERALGPTIKTLPSEADLAGLPQHQGVREDAQKAGVSPAAMWMQNNVRPGTFFKKPGGGLSIYNPQ